MNCRTSFFGVASTSSTTCSITGLEAVRLNDGNRIDRFRIAGAAKICRPFDANTDRGALLPSIL